jgi:hypothetical protein
MPASLRERRDDILRAILVDARRATEDPPDQWESPTSHANLMRLYHLYWRGVGAWQKGAKTGPSRRSDWKHQPDREVLIRALWYMRATINAYSAATAGSGPNGTNPVWQLPVYGTDPYKETGGPGALVADCGPQPPSSQESLWLLGSTEEEEAGVGPQPPSSQESLWLLGSTEEEEAGVGETKDNREMAQASIGRASEQSQPPDVVRYLAFAPDPLALLVSQADD